MTEYLFRREALSYPKGYRLGPQMTSLRTNNTTPHKVRLFTPNELLTVESQRTFEPIYDTHGSTDLKSCGSIAMIISEWFSMEIITRVGYQRLLQLTVSIFLIGLGSRFLLKWWSDPLQRNRHYPPGPKPRFLIGNLLDIPLDKAGKVYKGWSQDYQSITTCFS